MLTWAYSALMLSVSHYMCIVIEHGVLTFKLSKIAGVHCACRPANQDQEQTSVVQRGFKGSQRPPATTWVVVGLKWQQRVLGWRVGLPAWLALAGSATHWLTRGAHPTTKSVLLEEL